MKKMTASKTITAQTTPTLFRQGRIGQSQVSEGCCQVSVVRHLHIVYEIPYINPHHWKKMYSLQVRFIGQNFFTKDTGERTGCRNSSGLIVHTDLSANLSSVLGTTLGSPQMPVILTPRKSILLHSYICAYTDICIYTSFLNLILQALEKTLHIMSRTCKLMDNHLP